MDFLKICLVIIVLAGSAEAIVAIVFPRAQKFPEIALVFSVQEGRGKLQDYEFPLINKEEHCFPSLHELMI